MTGKMPEIFLKNWEKIAWPAIFTTVDKNKKPNAVYVGCFKLSENKIVIANNKFYKTAENVNNGSYGAFLFITQERIAYQVKGPLKNYKSGPIYDEMKQWLDPKYPGYSAVVLTIEEIYSGREKIL